MANIRRWMAEARRAEESGDLQQALELFRKALAAQEETSGFADLSLYNGLGDLLLRAGRKVDAIEAFEKAVRRCEDQQLYANGIALCKKILRNAPDHIETHQVVGRLLALSGLEEQARASYETYCELVNGDGRKRRAALAELVEITADEVACLDLADELAEAGEPQAALERLRATRARREEQGRDVVSIVRRIQELQAEFPEETERPRPSNAGRTAPGSGPAGRQIGGHAPTQRGAPAEREADRAAEVVGESGDQDPGSTVEDASNAEVDVESLTIELQRALAELQGDDRLRRALVIVSQLLELQPDRFDLLHRKLGYAFTLSDEAAAIEAYLALGECLERNLKSFSIRTLSTTSSEASEVTSAITVQPRRGTAPTA